jgi:hypothetical protein
MVDKFKKVEIDWIDSKSGDWCWEYIDGLSPVPPAKCKTIGFIFDVTKEYLTVVQSISNTQVLGRITIPKCAILKVKCLGK